MAQRSAFTRNGDDKSIAAERPARVVITHHAPMSSVGCATAATSPALQPRGRVQFLDLTHDWPGDQHKAVQATST